MRFNDLTDEDKNFFKNVYLDKSITWDNRMRMLVEYSNTSIRTVQTWVSKLGLTEKEETESPELIKAKQRTFNEKRKRFLVTWAQNNTPVHRRFLSNIEEYAKQIKADIHVIAGRYKNPTSVFSDNNRDTWHEPIRKYLDAARHDIHMYLSIMSDVKIQPTAVNPMTGMQGMSGLNSCIFGSPKVQMEMIPVLEGCKPKMMLTTGACTIKNYTDSKSGKKGEFHHTLGFVIAEIKDDDTFFIRQVTADDNGDFMDLWNSVRFEGSEEPIVFDSPVDEMEWNQENFAEPAVRLVGESKIDRTAKISACILGDLHLGKEDHRVINTTLDFMKKVNPEHIILHDVFDGSSISHHEMKDPFAQYAKEVKGTNSLRKEVEYMIEKLEPFSEFEDSKVVIVRSNHDDFVDRWLKNEDWRKQPTPKNSMEYMEYSQILLKQYSEGEKIKGVIPELINRRYPEFITLGRSDSYIVRGWELGQHGDIGSAGSRGSLQQFRRLNTKIVVGHYHAPGRLDGALSVGTSTELRIGYNIGASNWLQSHVIVHENGKAQHLNFIDGEFTTLRS